MTIKVVPGDALHIDNNITMHKCTMPSSIFAGFRFVQQRLDVLSRHAASLAPLRHLHHVRDLRLCQVKYFSCLSCPILGGYNDRLHQRTLTVGGSTTVWLVSSSTKLD